MLLALACNWVSPRGIRLARDYFPQTALTNGMVQTTNELAAARPDTTLISNIPALDAVSARLLAKGFQVADTNQVWAWYQDPGRLDGKIAFIDARNDEEYARGHIPRAYQLDYYRPEKYLPAVMPAVLGAEKVVVYCNGGECEDSEFTALLLRQSGLEPGKVFVFPGGFAAWATSGHPVELEAWGSGVMKGQP